ncbi:MAG: hypothetical protein ACTHWO_08865 [Nesterenkonia sp.]
MGVYVSKAGEEESTGALDDVVPRGSYSAAGGGEGADQTVLNGEVYCGRSGLAGEESDIRKVGRHR